jgi:hypothetical protein
LDESGQNVILIGVTFALLDLIEKHQFKLQNTIIMETGGMKGKRKEMIREDYMSNCALVLEFMPFIQSME